MGADIYDWERVHGKGSYAIMADAQDTPRSEDQHLIAFLTARLDDDERYLKSNQHHLWTQRPLREVEAKREILRIYTSTLILVEHPPVMGEGHPYAGKINAQDYLDAKRELAVLRPVVEALAAIYSDHPDYRPEWAVVPSSTRTGAAAQQA